MLEWGDTSGTVGGLIRRRDSCRWVWGQTVVAFALCAREVVEGWDVEKA